LWQSSLYNGVVFLGYEKTKMIDGVVINHAKDGGMDYFGCNTAEANNKGSYLRITGYAKFYEGLSIDWKLGVDGGVFLSRYLPSTRTPPA
jgi:hypothetical protein